MGERENDIVHREIAYRIEQDFFTNKEPGIFLKRHPWEILDFSSCFSIEGVNQSNRWGVYVKVPKADVVRRTVIARTEDDRQLAQEEFKSLRYLDKYWSRDNNVSFVKPLSFYSDHNAIVTERVYASDIFLPFRSADLRRKIPGEKDEDGIGQVFHRLGKALRSFHDASVSSEGLEVGMFSGEDVVRKIRRATRDLQEYDVDQSFLKRGMAQVEFWSRYRIKQPIVMTLKGLDIRNILRNENDEIFLLDPGKMKPDFSAADLGRFLVTCTIVYWGSFWFFIGLYPHPYYERRFLEGYFRNEEFAPNVLILFQVKELYKQWRAGHIALSRKNWPKSTKMFLKKSYIDPFFKRHIQSKIGYLTTPLKVA